MRRQFSELNVTAIQPSHYLRRNTEFVVWPEPDKDYTGYMDFVKNPIKLSSPDQKTTFTPNWDVALIMLATHHAHLSLGNQEQAAAWLGRFLGYVSSRIKEEDVSADVPRGGLNVAHSFDDIVGTPPQYGG